MPPNPAVDKQYIVKSTKMVKPKSEMNKWEKWIDINCISKISRKI